MRQRAKRLVAYALVAWLICQSFGNDALIVLAERITFDEDKDVTADSSDDYVYFSGGAKTLIVKEGVTLSGNVDFTSDSPSVENALVNNGTITGNVLIGDSTAKITNTGTIKNIEMNSGQLDVTGGKVTNINVQAAGTVSLSSCEVGTLETKGTLLVSGNVQINNLVVEQSIKKLTEGSSATLTVNNKIEFRSDIESVKVYADRTTQINNKSENDITVYYGQYNFLVKANQSVTPEDVMGRTIRVSASENSHIAYTDVSDKKYMENETCDTITLTAEDGYYFPDNYCDTIRVSKGSGMLTATRESEKIVTIQYQVYASDGDEVTIEIGDASVIPKEMGEGSISVGDIYYGMTLEIAVESDTNDTESVTIEYKKKDEDDTTYSAEVPKAVGSYTVRATFAESDTHLACVDMDDFNILYFPLPDNSYVIEGEKGENDFYISKVAIIPTEGYSIATEIDGTYMDKLEYEASHNAIQAFLKKKDNGAKTEGFDIPGFKIDTTSPVISATDGQTYYGESVTIDVTDTNLSIVTYNGISAVVNEGTAQLILNSTISSTQYNIIARDLAGLSTEVNIIVADEWLQTGMVPTSQSVQLSVDTAYQLGSGTWTVEGDTTQYNGSQSFFVREDGAYTFKAQ